MAEITNGKDEAQAPDKVKQGVPKGAAKEESHAGYGGTDRLQSEAAPLHPDAGKDQAKDI